MIKAGKAVFQKQDEKRLCLSFSSRSWKSGWAIAISAPRTLTHGFTSQFSYTVFTYHIVDIVSQAGNRGTTIKEGNDPRLFTSFCSRGD